MMLTLAPGLNQQLRGPVGTLDGSGIHLLFEESMLAPGFRQVYADYVMDIWEVPNPAPYYEVMRGGPCTLSTQQRESVTAECASPAVVRRRELYMPGWKAKRNAETFGVVQQDGTFQAVALPEGASQLRFGFTPPHMEVGWFACAIGIVGLLWQLFRMGFRDSHVESVLRVPLPKFKSAAIFDGQRPLKSRPIVWEEKLWPRKSANSAVK